MSSASVGSEPDGSGPGAPPSTHPPPPYADQRPPPYVDEDLTVVGAMEQSYEIYREEMTRALGIVTTAVEILKTFRSVIGFSELSSATARLISSLAIKVLHTTKEKVALRLDAELVGRSHNTIATILGDEEVNLFVLFIMSAPADLSEETKCAIELLFHPIFIERCGTSPPDLEVRFAEALGGADPLEAVKGEVAGLGLEWSPSREIMYRAVADADNLFRVVVFNYLALDNLEEEDPRVFRMIIQGGIVASATNRIVYARMAVCLLSHSAFFSINETAAIRDSLSPESREAPPSPIAAAWNVLVASL